RKGRGAITARDLDTVQFFDGISNEKIRCALVAAAIETCRLSRFFGDKVPTRALTAGFLVVGSFRPAVYVRGKRALLRDLHHASSERCCRVDTWHECA